MIERAAMIADALAGWATTAAPDERDLVLARRSLVDTFGVAAAAAMHDPWLARLAAELGEAGQLAALAHALDYDDVHLESTTHVSAVCAPAAIAAGGGAAAFLAGAGVMARLGTALGWPHYGAGWHATCTVGAPAAAAAAGIALGLDAGRLAVALALAVPAAGGVQCAFGTHSKCLQVGFAAEAGVRAARLAAAGATADPIAVDQWFELVGGSALAFEAVPAVPGGLAVKAFPCCYALQRPIEAVRAALEGRRPAPDDVASIAVTLPEDVLRPLIHDRPATGLEGKFSLQYAVAAAAVDERPGLASFTDAAVARPAVRRLVERVNVHALPGGGGLLSGEVAVELRLKDGEVRTAVVAVPFGAPARPLDDAALRSKVADCAGPLATAIADATWESAAAIAAEVLGVAAGARA